MRMTGKKLINYDHPNDSPNGFFKFRIAFALTAR